MLYLTKEYILLVF
uniref:Uncharacterized protein n=1 Tax=Rhizophora mucronata TaxID=61149 RepID=A0A2P2QSV2_RHIMU